MCFLRKGPFLGKELEQAKFFCTSSYFFHLSFLKKQKAWLRHHWLQNCTYFEKLHIFFKFELMKTPTMSPAQSNEQYLIRLKISLLHNTPLWGVCKTYIMRSILLTISLFFCGAGNGAQVFCGYMNVCDYSYTSV